MSRDFDSANPGCQHIELSRNAIGNVQICPECGVVHLTVQSMTVRLTPDAFETLAELTRHAYLRLNTDARVLEPPVTRAATAH